MNPAAKALWFVEMHFTRDLTLDDVAAAAGLSRFHMSRLFGLAAGRSFVQYVRARRLTEAARVLAAGAPDILAVALDFGYGSHEAFTRAFRDHFGLTPEQLRARASLDQIPLTEPIRMDKPQLIALDPPRLETRPAFFIAGISERYTPETTAGIPAQWQRFVPYLGHIPGQTGRGTYGVLCNGDDSGNSDYICAVEVSDFSRLPTELARLRIPEQHYAVFTHHEHISAIQCTWFTIWNQWLPASGRKPAEGPEFEYYGPSFNPRSGNGGLEIWIPLQP